jgi:hypothetical protein
LNEREHHFALLGVCWAKVEATGRVWHIPDGSVAWIGWPVSEFGGIGIPGPPGSTDLERRTDAGRVHISMKLAHDDAVERATAVADAIAGMMASPESGMPIEPSVVPISDTDVAAGEVDTDALARDHFRGVEYESSPALRNAVWKPSLTAILDRLDVVLSDPDGDVTGLLPALVFWRLAVDEYALTPHEVRDALANPDDRMPTRIEQARAEQSIHNAFKALEALIGGWPPKDETKFAKRLTALSLDPSAAVGPERLPKQTLLQQLIWLRELRSKQAAHAGMTGVRDRSVSWQQLITAHWAVWHCIYERIQALHADATTTAAPADRP